MLSGFDDVLQIIEDFRQKRFTFPAYKRLLFGRASLIGYQLNYQKNWDVTFDAWLELIEHYYGPENWCELGCSLGNFLADTIKNEPLPLRLPENDRVVIEHFKKG